MRNNGLAVASQTHDGIIELPTTDMTQVGACVVVLNIIVLHLICFSMSRSLNVAVLCCSFKIHKMMMKWCKHSKQG